MAKAWVPEAIRLYLDEKLSCRQIADKLGLTRGNVHYQLRKARTKSRSVDKGMLLRFPNGRFGELASNWRGGRRVAGKGYICVLKPDHPNASTLGYVMEHRLVMEKKLGRYLGKGEVVHHINGKKDDNNPTNLEVMTRGKHIINHFADGLKARELERENKDLKRKLCAYSGFEERLRFLEIEIEKFKERFPD